MEIPKEIEQILRNQIVMMGMLQDIQCKLEGDDMPEFVKNIEDTHKLLVTKESK